MNINKSNNLKNEEGITIITLMVTIVILIILAGITISSMNTSGVNQVKNDKSNLAQTENSISNDIDKLYNNIGSTDKSITADFEKTTTKIIISNIHTYNNSIASETYTIQIRPVSGTYSTVETGKTSADTITITNLQQSTTYMIKITGSASNLTTEKSITTDTLQATKLRMVKANGAGYVSNTWTNDYVDISLEDSKYDSTYASITGSAQAINTTSGTTRINVVGTTGIRVTTTDGISTVTQDYKIMVDNIKPTVTMALKKGSSSGEDYVANKWSNQDIFVGSTASDEDSGVYSISITIDGNKSDSTTAMITTEGTHTVKISAVDYAGNISESDEINIKIDKTNPTASVVASVSAKTINYNISTSDILSGIDITNSKYIIDTNSSLKGTDSLAWNGANQLTTSNISSSITETDEGIYYAHLLALDNAGNAIEKISGALAVDVTAPTLTVTSMSTGDAYPDTLKLEAIDNITGVDYIELPDGTQLAANGITDYISTSPKAERCEMVGSRHYLS